MDNLYSLGINFLSRTQGEFIWNKKGENFLPILFHVKSLGVLDGTFISFSFIPRSKCSALKSYTLPCWLACDTFFENGEKIETVLELESLLLSAFHAFMTFTHVRNGGDGHR